MKGRWGWFGIGVGMLILVLIFVSGLFLIPRYRASNPYGLQRSDADQVALDGMYLDVTPILPGMARRLKVDQYVDRSDYRNRLPVLVGLNTHTGNISHVRLNRDGAVYLIGPEGNRYPALEEPMALSSHHNTYLVFFPSRDHQGREFLEMSSGRLMVRFLGVGQRPARAFAWELPLQQHHSQPVSMAGWLMLLVAIAGAMLVVLSPCAVELTLYYTGIVGAVLAQYGSSEFDPNSDTVYPDRLGEGARWSLLKNLGAFTGGFTLLYALSGATVGLIGQGIKRPLGQYEDVIAWIGGGLILFFSFKMLGLFSWGGLQQWAWSLGRFVRRTFVPDSYQLQGTSGSTTIHNVNPGDSFLAGIGLSSGCLSCMGGAVLYPLLVYAGIASWYWGMVTLGLYSLLIAIPMMFIALGSARWMDHFVRRRRAARVIQGISGLLLMGVGLLIITGQDRLITDVTFGGMAQIIQWFG